MTTLTDTKPDTNAGMYALAVTETFQAGESIFSVYSTLMHKLRTTCDDRNVGIRAYHKNQGGAEKVTFTIIPGDPYVVIAEAKVVPLDRSQS